MQLSRCVPVLLPLLVAACDSGGERVPAADSGARPAAAEGAATQSDAAAARTALVNRVWTQAEAARNLPGTMRIFLSDGTLVQDSCWETHRLSAWRVLADGRVEWSEDGEPITADIVAVDERALVLRLHLRGGDEEQRYVAAPVPYLCPDMPR